MKLILYIVVITCINASITPELIGFIHGYGEGTGMALEMQDLFECAQDVNIVSPITSIIIAELKQGNLESIINGLQDLAYSFNIFAQDCGNFVVEIHSINTQIKDILSKPNLNKIIEHNIYTNAETIGRSIATITSSLMNVDGFTAGLETGRMIRMILEF